MKFLFCTLTFLLLSSAGATQILTDPASDTSFEVLENYTPSSPRSVTWTDLASLEVEEFLEGFHFQVNYHADAKEQERGSPSSLDVFFTHEEAKFRLDLYSREFDSGAALFQMDGDKSRSIGGLELEVDEVARTYGAFVPRQFLKDDLGAAPFPGRVLENFLVQSYTIQAFLDDEATVNDWDQMPDDGIPAGKFEVTIGPEPRGDARLFSALPSRSSNGDTTTFVYQVVAGNVGNPATFLFQANRVPDGWTATVGKPALHLTTNEYVTLPVVVTLPARHQHGETESFEIEMIHENDQNHGATVPLSVLFHTIPQPAGHHSNLFFHALAEGNNLLGQENVAAYMNTLKDDAMAINAAVSATAPGLTNGIWRWEIPLSPVLKTGLDFEIEKMAYANFSLDFQIPPTGTLQARLIAQSSNYTVLARSEAIDLEPNVGEQEFSVTLSPSDESDFFSIQDQASVKILLDYVATASTSEAEAPSLLPGGTLSLPLREFQDPSEFSLGMGDSAIKAEGPSQKLGNPGDKMLFLVSSPEQVELSVVGNESNVAITPLQTGETAFVVTVPNAEFFDFVVQGKGPDSFDFIRFAVQIVKAEVPDDAEAIAALIEQENQETPGLGIIPIMVALLCQRRRILG